MNKELFDAHIHEASGIISHAGIGSISMSLSEGKPLLVMPRLKRYGETVNDYQLAIAKIFERLGHLLAVYENDNMSDKIKALSGFVPTKRKTNVRAVAERISEYLTGIEA